MVQLKRLAEFPEPAFKALIAALTGVQATYTPRKMAAMVVKRGLKMSEADVSAILTTACGLYWLKEYFKLTSAELANDISDAAVSAEPKKLAIPANRRDVLRNRLTTLLGFDDSLGVTAKAVDVMTENNRVFCSGRILSDIRPVFATGSDSATSAVIIHNLQIGYHASGEHKEFYVALDTEDIKALKELIVRAEKKTLALKGMLSKAGMNYLEV